MCIKAIQAEYKSSNAKINTRNTMKTQGKQRTMNNIFFLVDIEHAIRLLSM